MVTDWPKRITFVPKGLRMSLRAAINAKCKECIYDPIGGRGNWRQQVEACTAPACPLFPVRPTSKGGQNGAEVDSGANLPSESEAA